MIGKLKGIIDSYGEDFIVLDVNGVGYLVQCSARTLQELPGVGQPALYGRDAGSGASFRRRNRSVA